MVLGLAAQTKASRPVFRVEVTAKANRLLKSNGYTLDHGSNGKKSYVLGNDDLLQLLEDNNVAFHATRLLHTEVRTVGRAEVEDQMSLDDCFVPLDAYPSYDLYEELMEGFAANFPDLVRLHELGTLSSGRKILALEITDNPDLEEEEPKVLLTSSMHGDELAGYHVTLRLIADLVCGYQTDPEIQAILNETEVWINPLANPNGAYRNNNEAIINPSRGNANFIDLNRNFPDPDDGDHPDGQAYQEETLIFMQFAEDYSFDLSMNIHGGAEVFNYPWDTYSERTADDEWWIHLGRNYADGCQEAANHNGYMDALNNGITNGYDWYPIYGGRQDYVNYFHRGREATLEISNTKTAPPEQFAELWSYNRGPLLTFIQQGGYGLRGTVTDSLSGAPLSAIVSIPGHDALNSEVFSKLPTGRYHRYLKSGEYTVRFSASGYHSKEVTLQVWDDQPNWQHIRLAPVLSNAPQRLPGAEAITVLHQSGILYLNQIPAQRRRWSVQLLNMAGQKLQQIQIPDGQIQFSFSTVELPAGIYACRITDGKRQRTIRFNASVKKKKK